MSSARVHHPLGVGSAVRIHQNRQPDSRRHVVRENERGRDAPATDPLQAHPRRHQRSLGIVADLESSVLGHDGDGGSFLGERCTSNHQSRPADTAGVHAIECREAKRHLVASAPPPDALHLRSFEFVGGEKDRVVVRRNDRAHVHIDR